MKLHHVAGHSFDPAVAKGNIENFTGVAQIPLGFAGPLRINGEHAKGEFLIPLATTEGTLVASYNRGMKVLNLSGGVTCTISADCMQRAPVFVFDSAREARDFRNWVTGAPGRDSRRRPRPRRTWRGCPDIDTYLANKFAFLRFNYTTGDAAGQNMVGRATFAACSWIVEHYPDVRRFYLESNFATDKKASHVNVMRTRGKRVTAEAVIPRAILKEHLRVEPESLVYHWGVANVGAFMSGANNNGAPLAQRHHRDVHRDRPGRRQRGRGFGGRGLHRADCGRRPVPLDHDPVPHRGDPRRRHRAGDPAGVPRGARAAPARARSIELAEIVAGVVLAGELSLASAISSLEWVSAHERYGRHR